MNPINHITLNKSQKARLLEMTIRLFPDYKDIYYSKGWDGSEISLTCVGTDIDVKFHWFEFVVNHLSERVAILHAKQFYATEGFSKFLVRQKIVSQEDDTIVDVLYDMWKNPQNYSMDLQDG